MNFQLTKQLKSFSKNLLICLICTFSFGQKIEVIGTSQNDDFSSVITSDNKGNVYFGYTSNKSSAIIKQDSNQQVLWTKAFDYPFVSTIEEIKCIDVIGDTVFGCGWLGTGIVTNGSFYFKLNATTGVPYWIKYSETNLTYLSAMRYSNGKYFLVGSKVNGGNDYEGKVMAVESSTGNKIWETPSYSLLFKGFNINYIDDMYSSTEMLNGKMFICGRSYIFGSDQNKMRSTVVGIKEDGTIFLNKYLLFDIKTADINHRCYGLCINYVTPDSLILTQTNINSSIETTQQFKTTLIKMDTACNISWAKQFNIQNGLNQVCRSLNSTPNGYVIFGQYTNSQSTTSGYIFDTDRNGNIRKAISLNSSGHISAYNGTVFVGGSSKYINNKHYFIGVGFQSVGSPKNVVKVIYDGNNTTNNNHCIQTPTIQVSTSNFTPYSEDLIRVEKPNTITYADGNSSTNTLLQNDCANLKVNFNSKVMCDSIEITASITGSTSMKFDYEWSNGSKKNTIKIGTKTQLKVTINDLDKCCVVVDTITPLVVPRIKSTIHLGNDTTVCSNALNFIPFNGMVTNPTLGDTYLWNTGSTSPTIQVNSVGIYWVELKNLCDTVRDSITISSINLPKITLDSIVKVCSSNFPYSIVPVIENQTSLLWDNNSTALIRSINNYGTYSISAENRCGTVQKKITVSPNNSSEIKLRDTSLCLQANQAFLLNATIVNPSNSDKFLWNTGDTTKTLTISNSGTYWCHFTNACTDTYDTVVVTINRFPRIETDSIFRLCTYQLPFVITPTVYNSNQIKWEDGSTNLSRQLTNAGTFEINVQNNCGTATQKIIVATILIPPFNIEIDTVHCLPYSISILNSQNLISNINFGDGIILTNQQLYKHVYNLQGNYILSYDLEKEGCKVSSQTNIRIVIPPTANFFMSDSILMNSNAYVEFTNTSSNATNYNWNFGDWSKSSTKINETHTYTDEAGIYTVKLIAFGENDCSDTIIKKITIKDEIILYVPNTFTPNGDEANNCFLPLFLNEKRINKYVLYIFNRWGELIFESYNPLIGWDGTYHNVIVPNGTYIWKIEYTPSEFSISSGRQTKTGHVNVLY